MIDVGRLLIILGFIIVASGIVILLAGRLPFIGHLPGDILIRRGGDSFYFPLVTCLLLSVALTVVLNVLTLIFRR
jgi:ABC-type enterochelin transport system permease subunit